jgi:FAD synthase
MERKQIIEIGKRQQLNEEDIELLANLFEKRFPKEQFESYVITWAKRIKNKIAFAYADTFTEQILKEIKYKGDVI